MRNYSIINPNKKNINVDKKLQPSQNEAISYAIERLLSSGAIISAQEKENFEKLTQFIKSIRPKLKYLSLLLIIFGSALSFTSLRLNSNYYHSVISYKLAILRAAVGWTLFFFSFVLMVAWDKFESKINPMIQKSDF